MTTNPCKDCERKGCGAFHSQCDAYMQYRKERNEALTAAYRQRAEANAIYDRQQCAKRNRNYKKTFNRGKVENG